MPPPDHASERRPVPRSGAQTTTMSTDSVADRAITHGAWCDLVRRARLGREVTAAALLIASYAAADGTGIYCGVARMALDLEVGYSTARRYLARLRQLGLIECTARVRRPGRSDEYRLTLPESLSDEVTVPDPAQYREMASQIRSTAARTARPGKPYAPRQEQDSSRRPKRERTAHPGEPYDDGVRLTSVPCTAHPDEPPPPITHHADRYDHPSAEVPVEGVGCGEGTRSGRKAGRRWRDPRAVAAAQVADARAAREAS